MPVDGIGQVSSAPIQSANNAISQEEFVKLFLAQLNYQDPLEPLNNREFLAQLAQFSSLEQSRQINDNILGVMAMQASTQGLSLLGKNVEVDTGGGQSFSGVVEAVHYNAGQPELTVKSSTGSFVDKISLSQIKVIQK
ncbi:flagellar hook capping protein [Rheinheimera riviphila]|uniref:Basal-body rod modification protein FlgD n=1 Tax=Rheinheimera riviphila TaxID=1834037 RepID=A0A437QRD8_9GAMM|nr:flagellar hook capping FlgD N-terminal domain-containing protein [Rheinheimera riviphila]RVU37062.1 flagellar hook capping protein [Rheinheimera riviphila]